MSKHAHIAVLGIVLVTGMATASQAQTQGPVAVFNFGMKSETPEWLWLEKGLADRVITDLFQHKGVTVVQRDMMQKVADEMKWVPEMMSEPGRLAAIGQRLRPKYIISGVYQVQGEQLDITATIVELRSQKEVARRVVSGRTDKTLELMRQASAEVLAWLTKGVPEKIADTLPAWTRSIPAASTWRSRTCLRG